MQRVKHEWLEEINRVLHEKYIDCELTVGLPYLIAGDAQAIIEKHRQDWEKNHSRWLLKPSERTHSIGLFRCECSHEWQTTEPTVQKCDWCGRVFNGQGELIQGLK
jgi:hypothetical protein